jgi:hypothetical protein
MYAREDIRTGEKEQIPTRLSIDSHGTSLVVPSRLRVRGIPMIVCTGLRQHGTSNRTALPGYSLVLSMAQTRGTWTTGLAGHKLHHGHIDTPGERTPRQHNARGSDHQIHRCIQRWTTGWRWCCVMVSSISMHTDRTPPAPRVESLTTGIHERIRGCPRITREGARLSTHQPGNVPRNYGKVIDPTTVAYLVNCITLVIILYYLLIAEVEHSRNLALLIRGWFACQKDANYVNYVYHAVSCSREATQTTAYRLHLLRRKHVQEKRQDAQVICC